MDEEISKPTSTSTPKPTSVRISQKHKELIDFLCEIDRRDHSREVEFAVTQYAFRIFKERDFLSDTARDKLKKLLDGL